MNREHIAWNARHAEGGTVFLTLALRRDARAQLLPTDPAEWHAAAEEGEREALRELARASALGGDMETKFIGFWRADASIPGRPRMEVLRQSDPGMFGGPEYDEAAALRALDVPARSEGYRGSAKCRLCAAMNGTRTHFFTDGETVFVIPEGWAHYIRDHHIRPSSPDWIAFLEAIPQLRPDAYIPQDWPDAPDMEPLRPEEGPLQTICGGLATVSADAAATAIRAWMGTRFMKKGKGARGLSDLAHHPQYMRVETWLEGRIAAEEIGDAETPELAPVVAAAIAFDAGDYATALALTSS